MIHNYLHLTLSNIINKQSTHLLDEVLELQNFIVKGIETSSLIEENLIYKYSVGTLHHSLVDFLPAIEFHTIEEIEGYKEKHQKLIDLIMKSVNDLLPNIKNNEIEIKSIYKGDQSIALEVFPSKDILQFANKITQTVKTVDDFPKVKGFPPENPVKFPINLIRFFRPLTPGENEFLFRKQMKIDQELNNTQIKFKLKNLSLVVSDDYLSNPNPEIAKFASTSIPHLPCEFRGYTG